MSKLKQLREERGNQIAEIDRIAEIENPTDDDLKAMEAADEKIKSLDTQIALLEENQKRKAAEAKNIVFEASNPEVSEKDEKDLSKFKFVKFLHEASEGKLTGVEAEMHAEAKSEAKEIGAQIKGYGVPGMILKRTSKEGVQSRDLTAGTDSQGGYTVPTLNQGFIENLRAALVLRSMGAQFLSGLTGDIDLPRKATSATFSWAAENATAGETNITFDLPQLRPNRLTGFLDLSKQLLIQSSLDVERMVIEDITFGAALAFDAAGINGSGIAPIPEGILNTTGIGAGGNTLGIANLTRDFLVDTKTAVAIDNALMGSLGWLFSPNTVGHLEKTKVDAGSGRFVIENNREVLSYRYGVSTQVPDSALIFGNFRDLLMAQWGGLDIIVNPFTKAKEGLVEIVLHLFGDVETRHPESFAAITDL